MSHPTGKRRRKGHAEEEHENHERWLVSYADMLTLLFALFIVLYSMSQVDQQKYVALAAGLAEGFGAPAPVLDGGSGPLSNEGVAPQPLNLMTSLVGPQLDPRTQEAMEEIRQAGRRREASAEAARLLALKVKVERALAEKGLQDKARVTVDPRGLVVNVVTDDVLFRAHRSELERDGRRVLEVVAPVLRSVPNEIEVEGHTNTAKVEPVGYRSDAHLSSDRAARVVEFLGGQRIPTRRMRAVGYGAAHPLIPGTSERAHQVNRRVEVVLLSSLPAETRALLPEAVAGHGQQGRNQGGHQGGH